MPGQLQLKEILLPVILVLAIFLAVLVFPPFGMVVGVLSPVPLIVISLRKGKQAGLICTGLVLLVILVVMGMRQAMFFLAEYAVMAMIMAETLRLQLPFEKNIFFSALGTAALSGILLWFVFAGNEVSLTEFLQQQIKTQIEQSVDSLKGMGKDMGDLDEDFIDETSRSFAASYPGIIVISSLFGAWVNYSVVRAIMLRFYGKAVLFNGKFSTWMLPDQFIWIFILSAASLFLSEGAVSALGLNLFVIAVVIYCLQGMAVAVHFLEKKSVPFFLWVLAFVLIFTQPLLIGVLVGLGLFEMWADFRKLRVKPVNG